MMTRIATYIALALLRIYRATISPYHPPACRFIPSCSQYAEEAVRRHGPGRGAALAAKRLLTRHPFAPGAYDPVR
jgi:hypothetical protein